MRHGIPIAGSTLQQELIIATGLVEAVVFVDLYDDSGIVSFNPLWVFHSVMIHLDFINNHK